jgi:hypothetical protein
MFSCADAAARGLRFAGRGGNFGSILQVQPIGDVAPRQRIVINRAVNRVFSLVFAIVTSILNFSKQSWAITGA